MTFKTKPCLHNSHILKSSFTLSQILLKFIAFGILHEYLNLGLLFSVQTLVSSQFTNRTPVVTVQIAALPDFQIKLDSSIEPPSQRLTVVLVYSQIWSKSSIALPSDCSSCCLGPISKVGSITQSSPHSYCSNCCLGRFQDRAQFLNWPAFSLFAFSLFEMMSRPISRSAQIRQLAPCSLLELLLWPDSSSRSPLSKFEYVQSI